MNPLVKTVVKSAAAFGGGLLIYTGVKKFAPSALPADPLSGNSNKTNLVLAALVAGGAALVYFVGKIFKINILKN